MDFGGILWHILNLQHVLHKKNACNNEKYVTRCMDYKFGTVIIPVIPLHKLYIYIISLPNLTSGYATLYLSLVKIKFGYASIYLTSQKFPPEISK